MQSYCFSVVYRQFFSNNLQHGMASESQHLITKIHIKEGAKQSSLMRILSALSQSCHLLGIMASASFSPDNVYIVIIPCSIVANVGGLPFLGKVMDPVLQNSVPSSLEASCHRWVWPVMTASKWPGGSFSLLYICP